MKKLLCTPNQMLLLDKTDAYRNSTIDMALKFNCHIDKEILTKALNKEVERNDCLKLHVYKKFFKWYNEFRDASVIDDVESFDVTDKSEQEVEEFIDQLCEKKMNYKTAKYPFIMYLLNGKNGDCLVFKVLHVNMDAYSTVLTFFDIVKVYFSLLNNTPLTENLTSVEEFITNYNENIEKFKSKIAEDTSYFIDKNKALGEPTFMGIEGGYDGSKKRFDMKGVFNNHSCKYYSSSINKELAMKLMDYCKERKVNVASLFLSAIELYASGINNGFKDISMFYTSDLRAKLSEKALPLTNSTAIFFRRLIDDSMTFEEFVKDCDKEYFSTLRHATADISKIYQYLINLKLLDFSGRYEQIVYSFIPTSYEGLPEDVSITPYWPKTKEAADFIIYNVVIANRDGSFSVFYRYFEEFLKLEHLRNLHAGIIKIFEAGLNNPETKVSDLQSLIK